MKWFAVMTIVALIWGLFIRRPYPAKSTLESDRKRKFVDRAALGFVVLIGAALFAKWS
jgi:hypothetical protein